MTNKNYDWKELTPAEMEVALERWRHHYFRRNVVWPLIILSPYTALYFSILYLAWEIICAFYSHLIMIVILWAVTYLMEKNSKKILRMIDREKEDDPS